MKTRVEGSFDMVFQDKGLKITLTEANTQLDMTHFPVMLKVFMKSIPFMKEALDELNTPWISQTLNQEKFIEACESVGKSLKVPAEILKFFLIQYVACTANPNDLTFRSNMDIVNFMTFLARSYDSLIQTQMEATAMVFAQSVYEHVQKGTGSSRLAYYRNQIVDSEIRTLAESHTAQSTAIAAATSTTTV